MTNLNSRSKRLTAAFCLLAAFLTILCACEDSGPSQSASESYDAPDYSELDISEYVILGEYKGLTVDVSDESKSAGTLLWNEIINNAEVVKYPEDALFYYTDQTTRLYAHYADDGNISYGELLEWLGMTDEDIENEAKDLVKRDLVQAAILEKENIELTEEEKEKFFDRYAEKYTEIYGYSREYVESNLADEIYASMLYDKMMEYLIINNNLVK